MTDVVIVPINSLPTASTVGRTDLIPLLQGGVTKAANFQAMSNSVNLLNLGSYVAGTDLISVVQGDNVARQVTANALGSALTTSLSLYLPSGIGGISRAVSAKLADLVSTADYDTTGHYNTAKASLTAIVAAGGLEVVGSTVPANGFYLSAANKPAFSVNSVGSKLLFDTHKDTKYALGDGSAGGAISIYSQITTGGNDIVLAAPGTADIHFGNVTGGTGVIFFDTDVRISAWGNATRSTGCRLQQGDGSSLIELPTSGGVVDVDATLRGRNGANKDLLLRTGNAAGQLKLLNAANNAFPLTVTDGGTLTVTTALVVSTEGTGALKVGGTTAPSGGSVAAAIYRNLTLSTIQMIAGTGGGTALAGLQGGGGSIYTITGTVGVETYVEQLRVTHTASATNFMTITGSNGGNPVIDVSGGALKLSAGTSDIQWGKANVALGGGAAPTVGTIGGSGPAAAGQRNWLRFIESDGTASFIPVWR